MPYHVVHTLVIDVAYRVEKVDLYSVNLFSMRVDIAFAIFSSAKGESLVIQITEDVYSEADQEWRLKHGNVIVHALIKILSASQCKPISIYS